MSANLPTRGTDPLAANRDRRFDRYATRTAKTAFTIRSNKGRIARKRKKYMYTTERANYKKLLIAVIKWKMREAGK